MLKRLLLIVAIGAVLAACSPSGSGSSGGVDESLAPIESIPAESAPAS
jgi:hypothetical protein